jgi:hypothetical protein
MEQDDPEKRIAELERQLGEARAAAEPGTPQASQAPPAGMPFPPPPPAAQPFPPPPAGWQNTPQMAPPAFGFPVVAPTRNRGGRTAVILLVAGLPILILVIVGIVVLPLIRQAANPFVPTAPSQASAGSTQLLTPDGLAGLLGQIRSKFGDTMGFSLTVYPDYADIDRADPQNSQHKQTPSTSERLIRSSTSASSTPPPWPPRSVAQPSPSTSPTPPRPI